MLSCTTEDQFKQQLVKVLKKNPEIIIEAMEEKPLEFLEALNKMAQKAKAQMAQKQEEAEAKKMEEYFDNPLKPEIRSDENIRGDKDAPLLLVEYSDFECPYCRRGYQTVTALMEKYGKKIKFVYKHLPLSFHPNAMPAAEYYEAIRLQSPEKAWKFHDMIFAEHSKLRNGTSFLDKLAKKLNVNMAKLKKDTKSDAVKKRIEADLAEASKFGFQGTPGFLLNGIPVKGAYPPSHFHGLVDELKKRGKISL